MSKKSRVSQKRWAIPYILAGVQTSPLSQETSGEEIFPVGGGTSVHSLLNFSVLRNLDLFATGSPVKSQDCLLFIRATWLVSWRWELECFLSCSAVLLLSCLQRDNAFCISMPTWNCRFVLFLCLFQRVNVGALMIFQKRSIPLWLKRDAKKAGALELLGIPTKLSPARCLQFLGGEHSVRYDKTLVALLNWGLLQIVDLNSLFRSIYRTQRHMRRWETEHLSSKEHLRKPNLSVSWFQFSQALI